MSDFLIYTLNNRSASVYLRLKLYMPHFQCINEHLVDS